MELPPDSSPASPESVNTASPPPSPSPVDEWRGLLALGRRACGLFERHNIFYMLSAMLMLLGCFMLSLPQLLKPTQWGPLLELLGAINLYEGLVVLACGYILRNDARSREGWVLLLVEVLFLFDVTMTISALLPGHLYGGMWIAALSLALAVAKLYAVECGAAYPVFYRLRWFVVAALAYQYGFPSWMAHAAELDQPFRQYTAFLIWTGLGGVVLALLACDLFADAPKRGDPETPLWKRPYFRIVLVPLILSLLLLQTIAQSFVLAAPFYWQALVPLLLAGLTAYPALEPDAPRSQLNLFRWLLSIAFLLLVYWSVGYDHLWGIVSWWGATAPEATRQAAPLVLSPLRVNLLFAGLCYALLAWREHDRPYMHGAFIAVALALVCYDRLSLYCFLHWPTLWILVPLTGLWLAWSFIHRRYDFAFVAGLLLIRVAARAISGAVYFQPDTSMWLWYAPVLGFFLCLWLKAPLRAWRPLTLGAIFLLGVACSDLATPGGALFYLAGFVTLAVGAWMQPKPWAFVLIAYTAAVTLRGYQPKPAPTVETDVGTSWGWLFILAAFAIFGLAFFLTKRRLSHPTNEPSGATSS